MSGFKCQTCGVTDPTKVGAVKVPGTGPSGLWTQGAPAEPQEWDVCPECEDREIQRDRIRRANAERRRLAAGRVSL